MAQNDDSKPLALSFPFLLKMNCKREHAGTFDISREESPNVETDSGFTNYAKCIMFVVVLTRNVNKIIVIKLLAINLCFTRKK